MINSDFKISFYLELFNIRIFLTKYFFINKKKKFNHFSKIKGF